MTNTSKGHVLLYETYRGIPTRLTNMNKAVNTRTRIMFIVEAHTVRYSATYLYIIKDYSLVGQSCLFKVIGQMAWFVVLSLFVGVYDMKCLYRRSVDLGRMYLGS